MPDFPKTLLQYAGASLTPSSLDKSAVVLIDCQMEYLSGTLKLVGVEEALAQARAVLALARQEGTPVFHVVHHGCPGGALFDPDGTFVAIVPDVAPIDGEPIVRKSLPNAFAGTGLNDLIIATGRKELILAGFMTHMCVSATARAALDLGYRSTIVAAATATRDLPDSHDGIIPADVLQRSSLAALADRFAVVVPDAAALVV